MLIYVTTGMDKSALSPIFPALTAIASVQTIGIFTVVILMGVFVYHYKRKNRAANNSEDLYKTVEEERQTFEMEPNNDYAVPSK